MNADKRRFWNSRANLGAASGTHDVNLKQIEVKMLLGEIPFRCSILDVGCGDGSTLIRLAKDKQCTGLGVDFAENMIEEAKHAAVENGVSDKVEFKVGTIPEMLIGDLIFDCAITERCLINLDSCDEQYSAITEILSHVGEYGRYLMLEHSKQGLHRVNALRAEFGLEPITQPWHNLYMDDVLVDGWSEALWENRVAQVVNVSYPASTYYLFSRVVYAKMVADAGEEPDYNSIMNQVAVRLPSFGDFGYLKLWEWVKQ